MCIPFSLWKLLATENLNAEENAKYYEWYEEVEEENASD